MSSPKRVCLVSLPFVPVNMPGLGVSTLKAALAGRGIAADVFYGAFEFFRYFPQPQGRATAFFDYNLIASTTGLGDVFFAEALWRRGDPAVSGFIDGLCQAPSHAFPQATMVDAFERIRCFAARAPQFLEHCYANRDWGAYDVIGFSSTFAQNISSLAFAGLLRSRQPDVHLVFGGANCEGAMGEQIIRSFPQVDAVLRGEADHSFVEYVVCRREGRSCDHVPGLVYRSGDEVRLAAPPQPVEDMDSVPYPDFSDYFEQQPELFADPSIQPDLAVPIETSRGCWWGQAQHCTFCGLNPLTMRFRAKSSARAVTDLLRTRDEAPGRRIYMVDNIVSRRYVAEVFPHLEGADLDIFYETKSNLREQEVEQFARAGIRSIQPGIEGLGTEILDLMKKGVKGYQNIELLKWCAIHHVHVVWFYLYGFPHEPTEPYLRSVGMMDRLAHLPPPGNPNPVLLDRFSPLFTERQAYGLKDVRPILSARIAYRGVDESAQFGLAYHFEMSLPQDNARAYEVALWNGVLQWNYRYASGARFYQFQAAQTTLLIDTRFEEPEAYLLRGSAHRIHERLRRALPRTKLDDPSLIGSVWEDAFGMDVDDFCLSQIAERFQPEMIPGPESPGELDPFLQTLVEKGIVLHIDNRYLALAVDCTRLGDASRLGLADFAGRRGVRAEEPSQEPQIPDLIQVVRPKPAGTSSHRPAAGEREDDEGQRL